MNFNRLLGFEVVETRGRVTWGNLILAAAQAEECKEEAVDEGLKVLLEVSNGEYSDSFEHAFSIDLPER